MFSRAKNNRFKNNTFTINTNTTNFNVVPGQALNILYNNIAPNAILNAGGRADEVRCYPGTREEVIGLINKWRLDIENKVKENQLFWLSGPAGAGKTAIVQSVAEDWKSLGVRSANFFFFRADPSRSHAKSFVSTLLYQIFDFCPAAREVVEKVLITKPRVLEAGLEEQVDELICAAFRSIHPPFPGPILLLIDGLDECDSETKTSQKKILQILDKLVVQKDLPFIVLVASRAEPHISAAFRQLTSQAVSIFLDERYSPERDIRLFVTAEFNQIKTSHPFAELLQSDWPSSSDIDGIVRKSSGQFIYAATIMRFLSQSSAVPSLSLEKVQGIVPCARNSPFVHLDAFYTYILQQADDHKAVRDIFSSALLDERTTIPMVIPAGRRSTTTVAESISMTESIPMTESISVAENISSSTIHSLDVSGASGVHQLPRIADFLQLCDSRYTNSLVTSCIADISTVVQFHEGRLKFYHASLSDFLLDQSRSDLFHVDVDEFAANVLHSLWNHTFRGRHLGMELIRFVNHPTPSITNMFLTLHPSDSDKFDSYFRKSYPGTVPDDLLRNIFRLYYHNDLESYKQILKRWITWAVLTCDSDKKRRILDQYNSRGIPLLKKYLLIAKIQKRVRRVAQVFKF